MKKIELAELKLASFVTTLQAEQNIRGGATDHGSRCNNTPVPTATGCPV